MSTVFCTNCDNEAVIRLRCHEPKTFKKDDSVIDLCSQCKDAWDWGQNHANDEIDENGVNGY